MKNNRFNILKFKIDFWIYLYSLPHTYDVVNEMKNDIFITFRSLPFQRAILKQFNQNLCMFFAV